MDRENVHLFGGQFRGAGSVHGVTRAFAQVRLDEQNLGGLSDRADAGFDEIDANGRWGGGG
jgi:hypothetical protein